MQTTSWDHLEPEKLSATITRQMISGDEATLARLFLAKGAIVPRHSHVSEQYSIILSGALRFHFDDGSEILLKEGEILLIPGNVPHSAVAEEDTWDLDFFAPRREDWISRNDAYLRG